MAVKALMTDETGKQIVDAIRGKAGLEERVSDLEKNKVDKSSIAQTTGTAEDKVISQRAVTEELEKKFDKSNVVQSTGDAEDKVMSQKAATEELEKKFDKSNVAQSTGDDEDKVMSQAAATKEFGKLSEEIDDVSEEIDDINEKVNTIPTTESGVDIRINTLHEYKFSDLCVCGQTEQIGTPSINSPAEMVGLENLEIRVYEKNLFSMTPTTHSLNGVNWAIGEDGMVVANGTSSNYISTIDINRETFYLPAGKYVFNGLPVGSSQNTYYAKLFALIDGKAETIATIYDGSTEFTLESDTSIFVRCIVCANTTANNITFTPMIRYADIDDASFVPATYQTVTIPCALYEIDGVRDEFWLTSRNVIRNTVFLQFDGSETWEKNEKTNWFYTSFNYKDMNLYEDSDSAQFAASNRFMMHKYSDYRSIADGSFMIHVVGSQAVVIFCNRSCETVDDFVSWLQNNKTTVLCRLAAPKIESLSDQINEVSLGKTGALVRNTKCANMVALYLVDTKKIIDDINVRLLDIDKLETEFPSDSEVTIPDYWKDYITAKAQEILTMQAGIGRKCATFIHFTDFHFRTNCAKSPALIRYIADKCNIKVIINTGDSANRTSTEDKGVLVGNITRFNEMFKSTQDRTLFSIGNHDHAYGVERDGNTIRMSLTNAEVYALWYAPYLAKNRDIVFSEDGNYFYYDDKNDKIRYISLNCFDVPNESTNEDGSPVYNKASTFAFGQKQVAWLADTALDTPDGFDVVVFSHYSPVDGASIPFGGTLVSKVLQAFNDHSTYTGGYAHNSDSNFDIETREYDFTDKTGKIILYACGHKHDDRQAVNDGIYMRAMSLDSVDLHQGMEGYESIIPKTAGTTTEQAFDVYVVNRETGDVNIIRIGAGDTVSDKVFNYHAPSVS